MYKINILLYYTLIFISCNSQKTNSNISPQNQESFPAKDPNQVIYDTTIKTIHVLVALCDNKFQGIVPVPARIGNGQDPNSNLYWGCGYGVRSYFRNSKSWTFLKSYRVDSIKLERLIFKNKKANYYLVADAYDGKYIKNCTIDFLKSCSGQIKDTVNINQKTIGINGNSNLIAYIGHDGLMDFKLNEQYNNLDNKIRKAIILACISKKYFARALLFTKAKPLVWSTGLMSPEAYTLHDAVESFIENDTDAQIAINAAKAYSKYQKCSLNAAKKLLVSGF